MKKRLLSMLLICIITISTAAPAYAEAFSKKALSLSGKCAIIMDMDTGKILYRKNAKKKCHNASTTKLMTALVAVEKNKSLKKKMRVSYHASSTSPVKLGMKTGDSYYLRDLLHALLIRSANDTAVTIAERTSGSTKKFMKEVNKKVKKLGCKNTKFGTPNGLYTSKAHYTTAYDLALIMQTAYNNEILRGIMQKKKYSFKSIGGRRHLVESTNNLLKSKPYYCVGKTGTGKTARYCFTGVYTYKGHSYVIVTLGGRNDKSRWSDAKKMMAACKEYAKGDRKDSFLA